MYLSWIDLLAILALLTVVAAAMCILLRKRITKSLTGPSVEETPTHPAVVLINEEVPTDIAAGEFTQIVIGENQDQPAITIMSMQSYDEFDKSETLDINSGPISRLDSICQAVPSLLVADKAHGIHLMKVVINGELIQASDGIGKRAMAIGKGGIKEHARLFEVSNLQNMINAAAIWQVASVIVAQKHLADISNKLDEIKRGVQNILLFLDNQRKSRIRSTYEYLSQAYMAIEAGELPLNIRNQLESCERDLLEIHSHLAMEYEQKISAKVQHKELFGTRQLTNDISAKICELDSLSEEIALCLQTRVAAWHVLSLFPGEPQLRAVRRDSIMKAIDSYQSIGSYSINIRSEIEGVNARTNRKSTVKDRKLKLLESSNAAEMKLVKRSKEFKDSLERCDQLMLADARPRQVLLKYENGKLVEARES